ATSAIYTLSLHDALPISFALAYFGLYAMESLRLEKCYRSWKADLTSEHTPFMASLERFVRLDKEADFIGREALRRQAAAGPKERSEEHTSELQSLAYLVC